MVSTFLQMLFLEDIYSFAVDNVDFAEDTPNGKRTLHGTAMAIYQRRYSDDVTPLLELIGKVQLKTIKHIPSTIAELLPCKMPKNPKPRSPIYPTFAVNQQQPFRSWRHWTICWQEKADVLEGLERTGFRRCQSTCTCTAWCCKKNS